MEDWREEKKKSEIFSYFHWIAKRNAYGAPCGAQTSQKRKSGWRRRGREGGSGDDLQMNNAQSCVIAGVMEQRWNK